METELFPVSGFSDSELTNFSVNRLLALSLQEMEAVRNYFGDKNVEEIRKSKGLSGEATDVELEMIAQTWSEHCKHKIFQSTVRYRDTADSTKTRTITSLFKTYIKGATEALQKKVDYLRSVFHDNSGVVQFHKNFCLCFKVETHNSPSALDPYGGAITGIVGVNRDILGTGKGAKPIFNTNVLCFGEPDLPEDELPAGLLHPKVILHGVHHGIIDGGNQSGIPVAGGAFLFDESYTGKPLVFCGTGGILPAKINGEVSWINHIDPGDKAVMVGGRIGKDGIHGATFSSQELSEESPVSAVQIGDPITQKKMADFLLEARDLGLYKGITDNGAGGLSSSLGEMAEIAGGIVVDLDKCPLKYAGLAPWEIWVSESQERMSLSVSEETLEKFLGLAKKRDVEAAVIGEFTDSGFVDIRYNSKTVGFLSLDFLHNGLPVMELEAEWVPPKRVDKKERKGGPRDGSIDAFGYRKLLFQILSEPNVASKEKLVRQYDHEVQGCSIIKPFCGEGFDGPSDGGVLKPAYTLEVGYTVTHGICPRYGDIDTYHMAACAVDEAVRAHISLGGDPEKMAGLDNFCWPDPVESEYTPDGKYKMAQLVRACEGLYDACLAYGMPLISGKDSMKNDARIGGNKVSVRPTLLISLLGHVPDIRKTVTTDFKNPGDLIFLLGETKSELGGSMYEKVTDDLHRSVPTVNFDSANRRYRRLHHAMQEDLVESCHDCSDGGLGAAVTESAIGGKLGFTLSCDKVPGFQKNSLNEVDVLFSESPSRFVVTVAPENKKDFLSIFSDEMVGEIGVVSENSVLTFFMDDKLLFSVELEKAENAWKSLRV